MGFSVSASTGIIFIGLLIAGNILISTATNSFDRLDEAKQEIRESNLDEKNTKIKIQNVSFNKSGNNTVEVTVLNDGSVTLSVSDTDLLADGSYLYPVNTSVEGDTSTDLWLPGENLTIDYTFASNEASVNRVKIVTENGVSVTEVV